MCQQGNVFVVIVISQRGLVFNQPAGSVFPPYELLLIHEFKVSVGAQVQTLCELKTQKHTDTFNLSLEIDNRLTLTTLVTMTHVATTTVIVDDSQKAPEEENGVAPTAPVSAPTTTAPTSNQPPSHNTALKVLFLSSDTGGGHRASSESLANQFQLLYPGSTYELHDVVDGEDKNPINYFGLVKSYRHLSAHPTQWKILYEVTNSRAFELLADANMKLMCERQTRKRIMSIDPDVVVSVHPMMTNVPQLSCARISAETGKHIPIFTVVTDLGSGHCLWFANGMEKMFVGSDQIWDLAKKRGQVPDEKLVKIGLPIRHDFALEAERLGDRWSSDGQAYQRGVRQELELPHADRATILVMGGGEGVGSLSHIVNSLYVELVLNGMDALILVVCGRNDKLKTSLDTRDWGEVLRAHSHMKTSKSTGALMYCNPISPTIGCIDGGVTKSLRKILSTGSLGYSTTTAFTAPTVMEEKKEVEFVMSPQYDVRVQEDNRGQQEDNLKVNCSFDSYADERPLGKVSVVGLGFVTRMAEYMVASDVLVSKAGPGTISEAAALSLPVMLTTFLPGQEEGNVDFVIEGGFGAYCNDRDPVGIAEEVVMWLSSEEKMQELSRNAKAKGAPHAARDIAKAIGDSALKWKEINQENGKASIADIMEAKKAGK